MATKIIRIDDMDSTVDSEETPVLGWKFSLGNTAYSIDLTTENYEKLQAALQPFIDAAGDGQPVKPSTDKPKRTSNSSSTGDAKKLSGEFKKEFDQAVQDFTASKAEQRTDINEWAASSDDFKDAKLGERGRPNQGLLDAYYKANPEAPVFFGDNKDKSLEPDREDFLKRQNAA